VTRIVSGAWGGRRLAVPPGREIRPTTERVREAWLAILAPELPGARIVDLYAGSGALGLEALSRGAAHATFVERHPLALATLHANIAALGAADRATVVRGDALRFAARLDPAEATIVLADPPFAGSGAVDLAAAWQQRPFARILAVEHDPRSPLSGEATRRWGDIAVTFLRLP